MAHLLTLVRNEKAKISNKYVKKLISELVIDYYLYLRS